jgi:hypothetical protein
MFGGFKLVALCAIGRRFGKQLFLDLDSLLGGLPRFRRPVRGGIGISQVTKRASAPRAQ